MITIPCTDSNELITKTADWCETKSGHYQAKSVFLPAGQTPMELYKHWQDKRPAYLNQLKFHQIDDIYTGQQKGFFKQFFEENLPFYLDQMEFINEKPQQCDLAILGFGRNGHVAFHEPGLNPKFNFGCVRLAPETCKHLKLEDETWGVTYGVGSFLQAKAILLIVSGNGKEQAYEGFQNGDLSIPAAHLRDHADLTVLVQGY